MKRLIVNQNDCGQRLNKFIEKTFPKFPKSAIYKAIRKKKIKINGKRCYPDLILEVNDVFEIYGFDEFLENRKIHKKINQFKQGLLQVVYEDKNMVIVNKESGISSHFQKNGQDSLISRIWLYLKNKGCLDPEKEHSFLPALCNRLDFNTSGIVIAAKSAAALRELNEIIKNRKIIKTYLCLAEGVFEKKSDCLVHWLIRDFNKNKVVVKAKQFKNSKKVVLSYVVRRQFENLAELKINLFTGRHHQIRAQLAFIGHPIVGDLKYGSLFKTKLKLCASSVEFRTENTAFDYLNGEKISVNPGF